MRAHTKLLSILVLFHLTSCFEAETYPTVPNIEFLDIDFVDSNAFQDTLLLTFKFEDGDANIGLDPVNDNEPPFHSHIVFYDSLGSPIPTDSNYDGIVFEAPTSLISNFPIRLSDGSRDAISPHLPVGDFAFYLSNGSDLSDELEICDVLNFVSYDFDNIDPETLRPQRVETEVYAMQNEFHDNLHIEFERFIGTDAQGNDEYETINLFEIFGSVRCDIQDLNGRIPFFDADGQTGTIRYSMISGGFVTGFQDNEIRLRFYVLDRDLQRSNEVITPSFRILEIAQ